MNEAFRETLRVALPLMVSSGTFSLVLFADRTLLLWHDGVSMSAAMAAGNFFWVLVCLPVGIASMTGAIVSQYVGAGQQDRIGRFLWQSVWLACMTIPVFAGCAVIAPDLFQAFGQTPRLIPFESTYLRWLMLGAAGMVLETGLSGYFSGTERTGVIMWISIVSGILNLILDGLLIFGVGWIPALGVAGAGLASSVSFWFKAVCYGGMIWHADRDGTIGIRRAVAWDRTLLTKLLYFGIPTGLMFLTESGGFTLIVLRIGSLGDVALRATTMAINFNMIAFIPLAGVSVATSVLVGRHLLERGPDVAARYVWAALCIGGIYSGTWLVGYLAAPDKMMMLYQWGDQHENTGEAIRVAQGLLSFVAVYVVVDAVQLILAGALRGAGDTWFVLVTGFTASAVALAIGWQFESQSDPLNWWWWMITLWVWLLATAMMLRFWQGRWKSMRMV